ncbi:MAG: AAA family ATPase [Bryobacteraceae bacterium]|jgi:SpoVK/Ycf46/Vps4 family AAA+-type ATPase
MQALSGLTQDEADNVLNKSLVNNRKLQANDVREILKEKRQIIRKDGILEYFETEATLKDIGGLERLIEWLDRRRAGFFRGEVELANGIKIPLPVPKGVLLIGVPGGGKSLMAKAVSSVWSLPLLRLDIGRIFGGTVGQSEENKRRAIRVARSVAPAVLWLDEVEKAFPRSSGASDSGTSLRVMNTFLTWMQEKTEAVFVVATGNDIEQVPPELTRKGRFDEVFYVGCPIR